MKRLQLRRLLFLLLLTLSYTGSVAGDAWMMWDHLRTFHGIEHVCHHDDAAGECTAHHASMQCHCYGGHGDADHLLYVVVTNDASQRHHAPVATLPPCRTQALPDPESALLHSLHRIQRSIALLSAPALSSRGLRAPPVLA